MRLGLYALLVSIMCIGGVRAHSSSQGDLTFVHAHAYATIGVARAGAVFVTIRNDGAEADALIGVESGDAARAELHTHIHENGRMMMRPVEQITIPAGGEAKLQPGGDHIMLMGLKSALVADYPYDLVLIFRKAGRVPVEFVVEKRN